MENRIESNTTVEATINQLWKITDLFRGCIMAEDYDLLLFLISLKNDVEKYRDFLEDDFFGLKKENGIYLNTFKIKKSNEEIIVKNYLPVIKSLPKDRISAIINEIALINREILHEHFSEIFDALLYKIITSQGRRSGDFLQPIELSRLIVGLVNIDSKATIYNPFAGLGSYPVLMNANQKYLGQEINNKVWALGYLRLMAYGQEDSIVYKQEDSIANWPENEKFDLIISTPPFGRINNQNNRLGNTNSFECFTVERGIQSLNENGKLIVLVSEGFLSTGGNLESFRRDLIEKDLVETVISMPSGILYNTNIKTSILVINKNKQDKGFVKFIDASSFVGGTTFLDKTLNYDALIEFQKENIDSDFSRRVPLDKILNPGSFLNVQRYLVREFEGNFLKTVITRLRGTRAEVNTSGKWVRIKNLNEDNLNFYLDSNNVDEVQLSRPGFKIESDCLLISRIGKKLKPTYFRFSDTPIYITDEIVAFSLIDTKFNIEYLISELYSQNVLEQINSVLIGSTIQSVGVSDLMQIKINVPSIEEQKAKVEGIKQAFLESKKRELAYQQQLLGLTDESFREFASIKHTFRQYLNALKSNVAGTKLFVQNNHEKGITLDTIYSKNLNKSFGEHLLGLEGTISSMSKLLSSFETSNEDTLAKEHDLLELVEEAQNRFKNPELFQFEKVYFDENSFAFGEDYRAPIIAIDEDDFYRIFSNIISNAIDHGFKDVTKEYRIRTEISFDEKERMCILEVSNNGKAMPKDFTLKDLTTRGEKTTDSKGSGMGGADIKNIIKKYDGKFDILNTDTEEFTVKYMISLPLFTITL